MRLSYISEYVTFLITSTVSLYQPPHDSYKMNVSMLANHTYTVAYLTKEHHAGIFPSLYLVVPSGLEPEEVFFAAPVPAALFATVGFAPLTDLAFAGAGCLEVGALAAPFTDFAPLTALGAAGFDLAVGAAAVWPGSAAPFCCVLFAAALRNVEPAFCTARVLNGRVTIDSAFARGIAW
jgi:hypothetical protein